MRHVFPTLTAILVASALFGCGRDEHSFRPAAGYVPDEKTAIAIAVAVWTPIYGEEEIRAQRPYSATLSFGVWHVKGSLPEIKHSLITGGVAEVEISKEDGKILRVTHGM